jgi:hypothetical protein
MRFCKTEAQGHRDKGANDGHNKAIEIAKGMYLYSNNNCSASPGGGTLLTGSRVNIADLRMLPKLRQREADRTTKQQVSNVEQSKHSDKTWQWLQRDAPQEQHDHALQADATATVGQGAVSERVNVRLKHTRHNAWHTNIHTNPCSCLWG